MRKKIIITICMGIIILMGYWLFFSGNWVLKTINCDLDGQICSDLIMAELNKSLGKNTLLLKTDEISGRLEGSDRIISRAEMKVKLPNKLEVKLFKRVPSFKITNEQQNQDYLLIDESGVILDKIATEVVNDLPVLIWGEIVDWDISKTLPENITRAGKILAILSDKYDVGGNGYVESNYLRADIASGVMVKFGLDKSVSTSIDALQLLLNQVKMDESRPKEIDLRFNNPIVVN